LSVAVLVLVPRPVLDVRLPRGCLRPADPSVVHREVEPAVRLHGEVDDRLVLLRVRRILFECRRRTAGLGNRGGYRFRTLEIDIGDDDGRAIARELLRDCFSQAGSSARDDRDLICKPCHGGSFLYHFHSRAAARRLPRSPVLFITKWSRRISEIPKPALSFNCTIRVDEPAEE